MALVSNPYNTLPSLRVAHDAFHSVADNPKDESGDLYRSLAGLLHKYGLTDDIGIGLLHRHFTLTDDEIVVEFNNISIPVEANRVKFIEAVTKGRIMADGWRISKDGECLEPYEYVFVEKTTEYRDLDFSSSNLRGFTTAFIAKSHHFGVESVICLRRSPPRGSEQALEITEGRANICFTPDQVSPLLLSKSPTQRYPSTPSLTSSCAHSRLKANPRPSSYHPAPWTPASKQHGTSTICSSQTKSTDAPASIS